MMQFYPNTLRFHLFPASISKRPPISFSKYCGMNPQLLINYNVNFLPDSIIKENWDNKAIRMGAYLFLVEEFLNVFPHMLHE